MCVLRRMLRAVAPVAAANQSCVSTGCDGRTTRPVRLCLVPSFSPQEPHHHLQLLRMPHVCQNPLINNPEQIRRKSGTLYSPQSSQRDLASTYLLRAPHLQEGLHHFISHAFVYGSFQGFSLMMSQGVLLHCSHLRFDH